MIDRISFYFLKSIEYSFYAIFFLIPLVLSNNTSELFELNKMWLTWIFALVVLVGWSGKMIIAKQFRIQRTPLDIPLLIFFISQLISTLFSQDQYISFWGYYSRFNGGFLSTITYIFLYYAFVTNVKEIQAISIKKPYDLFVKLALLICGICLIALSIPLASPASETSTGAPIVFYGSLVLGLILGVFAFRSGFFSRLLSLTIFSGIIVALWGIPSHFGADPTCQLFRGSLDVSCWTEAFNPPSRIFSTLGQPAWLAAYLSFLIPLTIAMSLRFIKLPHIAVSKIFFTRYFLIYLITLMFYMGLIFANTRAGFIGFWIGNIVFFGVLFFIFSEKIKSFVKISLIVNLSLLILTFFLGIPITQLQQYTYPNLSSNASPQISNETRDTQSESTPQNPPEPVTSSQNLITDSGSIRLNVWQGAIDAWKANPIIGTGVETFAFAYYKHKPVEQNLTSEWDFLYNKAHNEYLNYLATTGILGLGSYLLLITWFLAQTLIHAIRNNWLFHTRSYEGKHTLLASRIVIAALIGGYISILISNFFGFSVVIINLFFFLTPAFVYFLSDQLLHSKQIVFPKSSRATTESPSGMQLFSIGIILLASFVCMLILLRYWNADNAYALGANYNRIGRYTEGYKSLENAVALRPGEPTFQDEFAYANAAIASAYILQENSTDAAGLLTTAEKLSDDLVSKHPNNVVFWKNRVRMYYLLSQVNPQFLKPALDSIRRADALAPNDAKILYNHGVILGQMDEIDQAITILEKTIAIKPDFRDARFALGLFYRDKAIGGVTNGVVVDQEFQEKAEEQLQYILKNINPSDEQVSETLSSWNK